MKVLLIFFRDTYPSDVGKVYYLTIQESMVKAGESQRRPGLHVDSPGNIKIRNDLNQSLCKRGHGTSDAFKGEFYTVSVKHFVSVLRCVSISRMNGGMRVSESVSYNQ